MRAISPHAPYSVGDKLLTRSIEFSRQLRVPLAMHIAETESELELLANGRGEFRDLLKEFGIWSEGMFSGGLRAFDYLNRLASCPSALIIHGNYLDDEELQYVAQHPNLTLVYCPRTHAAFGHRKHPWLRLIELGGNVAIGTDSRASNPDLSLFAELQFLASQHPKMSHLELLKLGSINGRKALLCDDEPQQERANFTAIRLEHSESDGLHLNLFGKNCKVVGTMVRGEWLYLDLNS
ncbi:MAG: amidohydrolase family protein [Planctomycetes bacterium]|nr:amidohydrolase family protein [Planctomycetota bacterium]